MPNLLHTLWFGYFWESLKGNGPEDLFHLTLLGAVGYLASRIGRRLMAEWREHKSKVEEHHRLMQEKADAGHKMLHHLIINSSADNCVPGLAEKYQPKAPES